jgi:Uma2 family endonuclease
MTTVTTLPFSGPFTRADLALMPDDGHRYELVDGALLVTPGPVLRHQDLVLGLALLLREACPPELKVVLAPFAVALATDTELQPDLLVAPRAQFTETALPGAPLLAVEVLSPSTRRIDLLLKRDRWEQAGCPSYWLVDPDGPTVTVLELRDGAYEQVAHGVGAAAVELTAPFPVRVVPDELLDD